MEGSLLFLVELSSTKKHLFSRKDGHFIEGKGYEGDNEFIFCDGVGLV